MKTKRIADPQLRWRLWPFIPSVYWTTLEQVFRVRSLVSIDVGVAERLEQLQICSWHGILDGHPQGAI